MIAARRHASAALIIGALILAVSLVSAARSHAATIPANSARQFYSVQSQGDHVYWFQRIPLKLPKETKRRLRHVPEPYWNDYLWDTDQPGTILSRQLNSSVVVPAYAPPPGQRIVGFKIRGGRIIVGLAAVEDSASKPTEVIELKQTGEVWTSTSLIARP